MIAPTFADANAVALRAVDDALSRLESQTNHAEAARPAAYDDLARLLAGCRGLAGDLGGFADAEARERSEGPIAAQFTAALTAHKRAVGQAEADFKREAANAQAAFDARRAEFSQHWAVGLRAPTMFLVGVDGLKRDAVDGGRIVSASSAIRAGGVAGFVAVVGGFFWLALLPFQPALLLAVLLCTSLVAGAYALDNRIRMAWLQLGGDHQARLAGATTARKRADDLADAARRIGLEKADAALKPQLARLETAIGQRDVSAQHLAHRVAALAAVWCDRESPIVGPLAQLADTAGKSTDAPSYIRLGVWRPRV